MSACCDDPLQHELTIHEIFYSIQGESSWAGQPCQFIRLTGCDLRCTYCDTTHAFYEGKRRSIGEILREIQKTPCPLIEVTGGEPLLQKNVHALLSLLCDKGYAVLLETSGAHDITPVDPRVHRIMDLKCPGSGESEKNRYSNLTDLTPRDEVKFVIGSDEDYDWSVRQIHTGDWAKTVRAIHFSPVHGKMDPLRLAKKIMADHLPVRLQLQLHKILWSPDQRGV